MHICRAVYIAQSLCTRAPASPGYAGAPELASWPAASSLSRSETGAVASELIALAAPA